MEYTDEQKEQFRREFAEKRRRQIMLAIPLVPIALLFVLSDDRHGTPLIHLPSAVIILGFIVIVGALAFSFKNWRCPGCGKYLGRTLGPRHCPKCGIALR